MPQSRLNTLDVSIFMGTWNDWRSVLAPVEEYFHNLRVKTEVMYPSLDNLGSEHPVLYDLVVASRLAAMESLTSRARLAIRVGSTLDPVSLLYRRTEDTNRPEPERLHAAHALELASPIAREGLVVPDLIVYRQSDATAFYDALSAIKPTGDVADQDIPDAIDDASDALAEIFADHLGLNDDEGRY